MKLFVSIDFVVKSASLNDGLKSSTETAVAFSCAPKALLETPTTLISELICVCAKPLLLKAVRFTVKGLILSGAATTFGT